MSDDEFGFDDDDAWWKAAEKAQDEFGFDDDDWEAAEIAAVAVTATAATTPALAAAGVYSLITAPAS